MENKDWAIGESVVVKPHVTDPDMENRSIGGWQGRIIDIFDAEEGNGEKILAIQWDSLTLENISLDHIEWCEKEGLSWSEMNLSTQEVEPAVARDDEDDVEAMIHELREQFLIWFMKKRKMNRSSL